MGVNSLPKTVGRLPVVCPRVVVLGTCTGTWSVFKYHFQVIVLVLVLGTEVLVLLLVLETWVLVLVLVLETQVLVLEWVLATTLVCPPCPRHCYAADTEVRLLAESAKVLDVDSGHEVRFCSLQRRHATVVIVETVSHRAGDVMRTRLWRHAGVGDWPRDQRYKHRKQGSVIAEISAAFESMYFIRFSHFQVFLNAFFKRDFTFFWSDASKSRKKS